MPLTDAMPSFPANSHGSAESVTVVGGGFTGAILAAQLLRKSAGRLSVVLIAPNPCVGRGVAYGTRCSGHLLNVPARDMSAFPEDPENFLRWARSHYNPEVKGSDFLPRSCYGDYVHSALQQEIGRFRGCFERVEDEAVAIDPRKGAVHVQLRCGIRHAASRAVLALGNFPPADLPLPEDLRSTPGYVGNPWAPGACERIAASDDVLLVGSGLTSVDVLIALRARGCTGKIHLLSRHGLLPNTHRIVAPWPPIAAELSPVTLLELMGKVRMQVIVARMHGYDWRAVIDAIRPATQQIWRSLPDRERRRFLRHLRPYWEVHRHRMAPEMAARVEAEIALGHAEIHAGRITACEENGGGIDVTWRDRRSGTLQNLRVQHIVNCTGPETDCRRINSPLLESLLRDGLARPDRFALGLDCAGDGALIDAHGAASKVLYALGPARKGQLWESTAVPEIRVQASELAALLASDHCNDAEPSEHSSSGSNDFHESFPPQGIRETA
jgi:uncharacterized NAD(P)/FAD-binding protein YdhS